MFVSGIQPFQNSFQSTFCQPAKFELLIKSCAKWQRNEKITTEARKKGSTEEDVFLRIQRKKKNSVFPNFRASVVIFFSVPARPGEEERDANAG